MQKRHSHIKWSLVDLTRPATELADELSVSLAAIYNARKRLGIEAPNLAGGKIGNKGGGSRQGAGRPPLEDAQIQYQIRIRPSLLEQVREYAEQHKLPVSELVRLALLAYMNKAAKNGEETHTHDKRAIGANE